MNLKCDLLVFKICAFKCSSYRYTEGLLAEPRGGGGGGDGVPVRYGQTVSGGDGGGGGGGGERGSKGSREAMMRALGGEDEDEAEYEYVEEEEQEEDYVEVGLYKLKSLD